MTRLERREKRLRVEAEEADMTWADKIVKEPQTWWKKLATLLVVQPDMSIADLAAEVKKSRQAVKAVKACTAFQSFLIEAREKTDKLPAAREAVTALTGGLTFKYSKGQLHEAGRNAIMDALMDDSTMVDAKGNIVPAISKLEKAKLGMELVRVFSSKGATIIGRQTNIVNNGGEVNVLDELDPALKELITAVTRNVPLLERRVEGDVVEIVLDEKALDEEEEEAK